MSFYIFHENSNEKQNVYSYTNIHMLFYTLLFCKTKWQNGLKNLETCN